MRDLSEQVARSVRAFRAWHGWTQEDLARRAKVSRSAVQDAEDGTNGRTRLRTLSRLAGALGCPVSAFFTFRLTPMDAEES